jgi:hypothetical protein
MATGRAFAAAFGALIVLATAGGRALAGGPSDLSGRWKLNHDLSDDPREKMREAGGRRGGAGPRGGHGGFGGRRGGRFGGGREAPEGDADRETSFDPEAIETLSIVHHDRELRITDGVGREHALVTDGRKVEEERSAGTVKMRAEWKDGHVVVTTAPEHGPKIVETYAVAADGSALTVTTKIEGRGRAFEYRRVYHAVR